jgi:predicted RNA-binding protein with PIN domain
MYYMGMKNLLIIDGYNVIKNFYIENISFADKRKKLLRDISNCAHYKNYEIIAVFDSKEQSFDYYEMIGNIKVIYAGYRKNADSIIENLVISDNSYDKKIVVTSDYALQQVVFGARNTIRKSSREFYLEITK